MGGKNNAPKAPDYSGLIAVNEKTAKLANDLAVKQFNWAQKIYNENAPLMKQTNESFLKTMENARIASEEDRARYKAVYQPMEDRLVADARTYDTAARRDREVGAAQANVAQGFAAARNNAAKQLESYGVNPSATRFAALDVGLRAQEAASKAAAGTSAAKTVEDTGRALTTAAINIGRGYPAQYVASQQSGTQAGSAAVGGTNQTFATGANAMGTGPQWLAGSNAAQGNWGDALNAQYNNQLAQFNANQNQSSGFGSILGMVGGMAARRFGFDEGGAVPTSASPSRGANPDDVPVNVSANEFVVPRETVEWLGQKHFYNLIRKSREERDGAVPASPVINMKMVDGVYQQAG